MFVLIYLCIINNYALEFFLIGRNASDIPPHLRYNLALIKSENAECST